MGMGARSQTLADRDGERRWDVDVSGRQHIRDWQIVKEFFGRYPDRFKVQFRVPSANPPQKDRVNCVNARLCNYAGDRRVLIAPKCKELAKDFEQVGWKDLLQNADRQIW
jgi:hypothetical protein